MKRRRFLKGSLLAAAGLSLGSSAPEAKRPASSAASPADGMIVDVNVDILDWPFRELKYGATDDLVAHLREHQIKQAWTGSFEALFHKNIDAVNAHLADEVQQRGDDILVPLGTVNPAYPDWKEDLRRVDETYDMPGIKLHPTYHGYALDDPAFKELLQGATERGLLVQIAIAMEDERMQHPLVDVPAVDVTPLPDVLEEVPEAQVMLVNPFRHVRGDKLRAMINDTDVLFGISNLDGTGGLDLMMQGDHWYLPGSIPAERLVFGSHVPFFPLEFSLFKLMESPLSDAHAQAIMEGNAERFLQQA